MIRSMDTIRDTRIASTPLGVWSIAVVKPIGLLFSWIQSERQIRRDIKTLSQFSNHMLADIGLSRADVEYVVRYGRHSVLHDGTDF